MASARVAASLQYTRGDIRVYSHTTETAWPTWKYPRMCFLPHVLQVSSRFAPKCHGSRWFNALSNRCQLPAFYLHLCFLLSFSLSFDFFGSNRLDYTYVYCLSLSFFSSFQFSLFTCLTVTLFTVIFLLPFMHCWSLVFLLFVGS